MIKIEKGKKYRHFKGHIYEVIGIVNDCDTPKGEELRKVIIYKSLEGEHLVWARKYDDFVAELDPNKYPGATQKHRFEEI